MLSNMAATGNVAAEHQSVASVTEFLFNVN